MSDLPGPDPGQIGTLVAALRESSQSTAKLREQYEHQSETLKAARKLMDTANRRSLKAYIAGGFGIVVGVLASFGAYQANSALDEHKTFIDKLAVARCEVTNESNATQLAFWSDVYSLSRPATSPEDQARRDRLTELLNRTFRQQDCSLDAVRGRVNEQDTTPPPAG